MTRCRDCSYNKQIHLCAQERRNIMRLVIKIGTSSLAHETGLLNLRKVEQLVKVIADLKNAGHEIVMVSSGAIGVGAGKLHLKERPKDVPTRQACAAVGQCELMHEYDKLFSSYNHTVAQVLLTHDIMEHADRKQNATNTLKRLLDLNVIPIINENDTVATEEIAFGDNDTLSAMVGTLVDPDLLIILSDIDGLYDMPPQDHPEARKIDRVTKIDETIIAMAGGSGSSLGTGGMATKIEAAKICLEHGFAMCLMNGAHPEGMYDAVEGKSVGTLFKEM